jgi:hypothetical protein
MGIPFPNRINGILVHVFFIFQVVIEAGQSTEVVLDGLLAHFSLAPEIVQEALNDILIGQQHVLVLAYQILRIYPQG